MLDNIGDGLSFMGKTDGDLWLDDAACQDLPVESFFVQAGHVIDEEVLNVCRECPVREDCLRHSYNTKLNITGGYFGGMSPGQRRTMSFADAKKYIVSDVVKVPVVSGEPEQEVIAYT